MNFLENCEDSLDKSTANKKELLINQMTGSTFKSTLASSAVAGSLVLRVVSTSLVLRVVLTSLVLSVVSTSFGVIRLLNGLIKYWYRQTYIKNPTSDRKAKPHSKRVKLKLHSKRVKLKLHSKRVKLMLQNQLISGKSSF